MKQFYIILLLQIIYCINSNGLKAQGVTKNGASTSTSTNFVNKNGKLVTSSALTKNGKTFDIPTDADGNTYNIVIIGTQTWLKENLKTTKYFNNDPIAKITDNTSWKAQTTGAYCWYNNDIANKSTYGALYNYYTVVDSRKLCPIGWHVPTDNEWKTLEIYLGMSQVNADAIGWRGTDQGAQLKSTTGWYNNGNGTNSSGFSAVSSGYRFGFDGTFSVVNNYGGWWSSTEYSVSHAWSRSVGFETSSVFRIKDIKEYGFSVRCIKDN